MPQDTSNVVLAVMDTLAATDVPPLLIERLEEHRANLQCLAMALIESGMNEAQTREVVAAALDSFKAELSRTIMILKVTEHAQ